MEKYIVNTPILQIFKETNAKSELIDEVLYGSHVNIIANGENGFVNISTFYDYRGYVLERDLIKKPQHILNELAQYTPKVAFLDILPSPEYRRNPVITIPKGSYINVDLTTVINNFVKVVLVDNTIGYCVLSKITPVVKKDLTNETELREKLVATAMSYLNVCYRWGGKTHMGIDCSGLCSISYLLNGIVIYRDASRLDRYMRKIPLEKIKKGDLLFTDEHVAMYIGDNKFIHSNQDFSGVNIGSLNKNDKEYNPYVAENITEVGTIF